MYLTAQRVKTLAGQVGINVLLYQHGGQDVPGMSWDKPDVELVADRFPGSVVAQQLEIAPGKNHVMSYLDVVAADPVDVERIARVLATLEREIEDRAIPSAYDFQGVGARFSLEPGLEGCEREEFRALEERCLQLLQNRTSDSWRARRPLTITVKINDREVRYALDEESTKRVREKHPPGVLARSITVEHETKCEFERVHGRVIPNISLGLTGLQLEDVIDLGGVCLIEAPTGRIIREWPKRSFP